MKCLFKLNSVVIANFAAQSSAFVGLLRRLCGLAMTMVLFLATAHAADPVDAIQDTYQNITDLQAQFSQQTTVEALGKTVSNRGTLSLRRPGQLRLEYQGNPQRVYISDGKKLWVYTPGDLQYQVYAIGGKMVPREALTFLNGFGELRKLFTVEPLARERSDPKHTYLRLRPRQSTSYRQLDCEFNERHLLVRMTIVNPSGNQTHYQFSNVRVNSGVAPELFRFTPPAGAHAVSVER